MTASLSDIQGWANRAKSEGATHLIVVCDTYDHDNYPVFVMPGESVVRKYNQTNKCKE